MKRTVLMVIIKMCGDAIFLTMIVGMIVAGIGYINKWDTSIAYSNALFISGCLLIVAGMSTRLAAGQDWNNFRFLHGESMRGMSNSERANFIVNASSSYRLVVLGLLSGILLFFLSMLVAEMF